MAISRIYNPLLNMFKFRKFIASLSILGISIQSIFGYGMLVITA
jgi:hypothetical protein